MRAVSLGSFAIVVSLSAAFACGSGRTGTEPARAPAEPAVAGNGNGEPAAQAPSFRNPGGMWLPRQLGSEHAETLRRLGLQIDPASLSDPMASPLGAVVSLGGCSASFVSGSGLVVTNHHCVTDALQFNSTPEKNLLENGFLANSLQEEPSIGPTGRVYVTQRLSDVTNRMREGLEALPDDTSRHDELEKRQKELVAECEKNRSDVRCSVAGFYGGSEYALIEQLEIKDVRLVYAPARGIGNFGGEVDNWRWPRHTGDFAFYRAYVGPDGKPAPFAPSNVPYQPRHHLKVTRRPLQEGDLVMVAGYPGMTYRLRTAAEAAEAVEWYYPRRIRFCEEYLAAIASAKASDPALAIKAAPLQHRLDNVLTYTRGALEGLTRGGVAEQRRRRDAELQAWVRAEPERQKRFDVFGELAELFAAREQSRDEEAALGEILQMSQLLNAAMTIVRLAEERPKPDADRDPSYQQRNWERIEQAQRALEKRYHPRLDEALLTLAIQRALRVAPERRKELTAALGGGLEENSAAGFVAALYRDTRLADTERRVQLLKTATTGTLRASRDPILRLALALRPVQAAHERRQDAESGRLSLLRPRFVQALLAKSETPVAPDANSTLRVTYGTVHGFRPSPEAPVYEPFTMLSGVVRKSTGKEPFDAPPALLDAASRQKVGPYVDSALGDVPVNFLADCDITGGNSGSATLNGYGELTGLAFDGNYESMASDWAFLPDLTASIHVDIRYVLWVMDDAVDHADRLLLELGVQPAIQ